MQVLSSDQSKAFFVYFWFLLEITCFFILQITSLVVNAIVMTILVHLTSYHDNYVKQITALGARATNLITINQRVQNTTNPMCSSLQCVPSSITVLPAQLKYRNNQNTKENSTSTATQIFLPSHPPYTVEYGYIEYAGEIFWGSIYPLFDISVTTDISNIYEQCSIYPFSSLKSSNYLKL